MAALTSTARRVIEQNLYLVLATADGAGEPLASPLFYAANGHHELYWASSPEVSHSVNLARRPQVSIVIFDSTAPVGQGSLRAVYLAATAEVLSGDDVDHALRIFPGSPARGGRQLTPAEVEPPGPYRMYRAMVQCAWMQCRVGDDPCGPHGLPYPHRVEIDL